MPSLSSHTFSAVQRAPVADLEAAPGQQPVTVPNASPKASINQTVGLTDMAITYHRPAVNKRKVWGELVPYDEAYEEGFEDMPRRVPDITKVSELIGFRPNMSLDGILESVVDYQIGRRTAGASGC